MTVIALLKMKLNNGPLAELNGRDENTQISFSQVSECVEVNIQERHFFVSGETKLNYRPV